MKLLAGGCSFIYGSELSDAITNYSCLTYPALLSKKFDLEYKCVATPGNGNDAICRQVIEGIDNTVGLVIVMWSYYDRFEFHFGKDGWQNLKCPNDSFKNQVNELTKPFYSQLTDIYAWNKYLQDIILLQTFLTNNNIPFIFSSADNQFFDNSRTIVFDSRYQKLYNLIDFSKWVYWTDKADNKVGFVNWAKIYGYPLGPGQHPLTLAHTKAYESIEPCVGKVL
jgi:hypothetical protein